MISSHLISWYKKHKRDLPWRHTTDPYKIWLSEVILQQTRVVQGLPYYHNFIEAFPTVFDLAKAPEQKVLKIWQGLGYYSRARNLHTAAKEIVTQYKGKFPEEYTELKKLKGIGDYTAAAISSFCFNKSHAVIDGNVYRVLARLFAIETPINSTEGKKQFTLLANELLDKKNPGLYNQAIMEYGAIHCTPQNPKCNACVLSAICLSRKNNDFDRFPVKNKAKSTKNRFFEYFLIKKDGFIYTEERTKKDIWQGLYQFPLLEFNKKPTEEAVLKSFQADILPKTSSHFKIVHKTNHKKHMLSHQTLFARFWYIQVKKTPGLKNYQKTRLKNLHKLPFPILLANEIKDFEAYTSQRQPCII